MLSNAPAIVIAAGGDGMRIGGNKPHRVLDGVRLIDRAVAWARCHSDAVAIAVRHGETDCDINLPLLQDRQQGLGPISALLSALHFAQREGRGSALLIGCDQPFLPYDLISRLSAALPRRGVALPISDGRGHPMAALWNATPDVLERYIEGDGRALMGFADSVETQKVHWIGTPDPFTNINDETALVQAEYELKKQKK